MQIKIKTNNQKCSCEIRTNSQRDELYNAITVYIFQSTFHPGFITGDNLRRKTLNKN